MKTTTPYMQGRSLRLALCALAFAVGIPVSAQDNASQTEEAETAIKQPARPLRRAPSAVLRPTRRAAGAPE